VHATSVCQSWNWYLSRLVAVAACRWGMLGRRKTDEDRRKLSREGSPPERRRSSENVGLCSRTTGAGKARVTVRKWRLGQNPRHPQWGAAGVRQLTDRRVRGRGVYAGDSDCSLNPFEGHHVFESKLFGNEGGNKIGCGGCVEGA